MKIIFTTLFIIAVCLSSAFSQTIQNEPQRFSYHIWGSVTDEQSKPAVKISVCFVPAERPINGRIPCTKTDESGNFAFTVKDVPDKYVVSASNKEFPLFFVGDEERGYRIKHSEIMRFGAKDECRKVTLKFDTKHTVN